MKIRRREHEAVSVINTLTVNWCTERSFYKFLSRDITLLYIYSVYSVVDICTLTFRLSRKCPESLRAAAHVWKWCRWKNNKLSGVKCFGWMNSADPTLIFQMWINLSSSRALSWRKKTCKIAKFTMATGLWWTDLLFGSNAYKKQAWASITSLFSGHCDI